METQKEIKPSIVYARISTNDSKQNIKQQIDYCKKWAVENNFNVLKVFKDKKTGKTDNRNGYQRMLKYLADEPTTNLIVQDTDRLSRNYYDAVEFERFIIENKINLISLSEKVDLNTPNGKFMFRIKSAMNAYYVENLIQKIKIGVARAKAEGKYKGRIPGYKNKKNR